MTKPFPNPIDKHVGGRVRMRRIMLKMSQTDLGAELGITFQQIQKYEKGANRISASKLQRISEVLSVPVSFFFEGVPEPAGVGKASSKQKYSNLANDFLSSRDGVALAEAFLAIHNAKLRRLIVDLAQAMANGLR
jgi:transcriptional regulator with XRE-family HTH domain